MITTGAVAEYTEGWVMLVCKHTHTQTQTHRHTHTQASFAISCLFFCSVLYYLDSFYVASHTTKDQLNFVCARATHTHTQSERESENERE